MFSHKLKKSAFALACITAALVSPAAMAELVTFDVTWASVNYNGNFDGGSAAATATLTMDTDLIRAGTAGPGGIISIDQIVGLSMTVTGAGAGDGIFGKSDFSGVSFSYNHTLNFSGQLIGQYVSNGDYTDHTGHFGGAVGAGGQDGDFNLFATSMGSVGGPAIAPSGVEPFMMVTDGNPNYTVPGSAQPAQYLLGVQSIIARPAVSAVPEPSGIAMMLAGLGFAGFMARRRR